MMMDMVEDKYQKIKGEKIFRGKCRKSIVAVCLFHTYQEFGEYCTSNYIQELFNLKQNNMNLGMIKYLKAFPEASTKHITPEKLLPWIMKLTGVDRSHYRRILAMTRYIISTSELVERSNPQSVAAAIIFFYLCLNQNYKNKLAITKSSFAKKAEISDTLSLRSLEKLPQSHERLYLEKVGF